MSQFYDQSSLVFLPSGYKDGKLYSQKPLSTSGELSFSRGSDIEATRVNANGYIEKAQVNLLLQSNSFDTTWVLSNSTMTSGQAGYDGTNDAWLYQSTSTFVRATQTYTLTGVSSLSVYAKAGTSSFLFIEQLGTTAQAWFNLSTGALGSTTGSVFSSSITSVGNGWYRCVMSSTQSAGSELRIRMSDANLSSVTTAASNIYIQDAQLNYGLVAQEYQETTTTSVVSGITNDMPRLDYSGGASCPSLLLEPQRTNLVTQSEYFSSHTLIDVSSTENATTSPEGVDNASEVIESAVTGAHEGYLDISCTTSTDYTISIFAKANTRNYFFLRFGGAGSVFTNSYVWYNLSTGSVGTIESGITANIEDYGNGWYRLTATRTSAATAFGRFFWGLADANGSKTYTGDGSSSAYAYGFQVEEGSYPTSYIPCYGTSATRLADDMDTTFASPFTTDGSATFFIELKGAPISAQNSNTRNFSLDFASGDYITYNHGSTSAHRLKVEASGTSYYSTSGISNVLQDENVKMAAAVTSTSVIMYVNGQEALNTSLVGDWNSATLLRTTIQDLIGIVPVKQFIFFPTDLSDSDLATLTTL